MLSFTFFLLLMVSCISCLDNGLAQTPPMGWLTWERFRCNTDCKNDPKNCISENLIKRMTDCFVSEGYQKFGYQYISVDDCWPEKERGSDGKLVANKERFPGGIGNLTKYVHSKGLKFGLYEDFGTKTCAGYPGSEFYMELDANTFAEWEVDLVKFDGCHSDYKDAKYGYPTFGFFLNKTGRSMLYSCEWPLYDVQHKAKSDFMAIRNTCNMWRNYRDVDDSWESITSIINYFATAGDEFQQYAGPGGWNDPDMLAIGNYGLSYDQERTQMAMWAVFASPLIMSVDLCDVKPWSKAILQNERVIAVNQDKLGIQGSLKLGKGENLQVWTRPISPAGSYAVVILNLGSGGGPRRVSKLIKDLGLTNTMGYKVTETFDGHGLGLYKPADTFECFVNPNGVFMMTAVPLK